MTSASESPTASGVTVIGGVDTHKHTHYAAAIDTSGRLLGHREFPANDGGYVALLRWLRSHGEVVSIGVESTGSFGATLTRFLTAAATQVVEVNRPDRAARHQHGKSHRLDAEQIARSVLSQTATATAKAKSGLVEVIRTLRVTRSSAVKSRTQAFNTLFGIMIGAPSPLRDELVVLPNEHSSTDVCDCAPRPTTCSNSSTTPTGCALYVVTIVRMRHHAPTRAYVKRRTAEGLSKREIIRCLKRYVAREVLAALPRSTTTTAALPTAA